MLDNKVLSMTPGEALLEVPVGDFIQRLGVGIAEAQLRLDQMAVRVAAMLSDARVEMRDAQGKVTSKSLLELGFTPTFYHFTETELEVRMTLSIKVEEGFNFGFSANVGNDAGSIQAASQNANAGADAAQNGQGGGGGGQANQGGGGQGGQANQGGGSNGGGSNGGNNSRAVAFGAAINIEYHRKYGFEMSGSSMVRTKMISVPPPAPFLEALREQARAGGSIGVGSAGGNNGNGGSAQDGNNDPAPADDDDDAPEPAPQPAPQPDDP